MPKVKRWEPTRWVDRKSGKVWWRAKVWDPDKGAERVLGRHPLKRDAQAVMDEFYDALDARNGNGTATVREYGLTQWLDRHPRETRTAKTNLSRIRAVVDIEVEGHKFGDWPLAELTTRQIVTLRSKMTKRWSPGYVRGILTVLSAMGVDACTDRELDSNVFAGATKRLPKPPPTEEREDFVPLTLAQMHNFTRAAGPYEAMVRLLADTGMRVGELFALKRINLDLAAGTLLIDGSAWHGQVYGSSREKNHNRPVPVPDGALELLRAMVTRIDVPWLFPTPGQSATRTPRIAWPAWVDLQAEIEATSFRLVARRLGVSDNALRKHMKNHAPGVVLPPPKGGGLWRYENWRRDVWDPACKRAGVSYSPKQFRASLNQHLLEAGISAHERAALLGHRVDVNGRFYTVSRVADPEAIRRVVG